MQHFRGEAPKIEEKVRAAEFRQMYTDYEYIYLTVLGYARLSMHAEEVIAANNGKPFSQNPCVRMLEEKTGMTVHADREGANNVFRSAPGILLEAFQAARADREGGPFKFFSKAFDRTADPCLEGRTSRIVEYLQKRQQEAFANGGPPLDDVSLNLPPPGAPAEQVVGEHLRVFVNECTWSWAQARGLAYEAAKLARQEEGPGGAADFSRTCNSATFRASMIEKGVTAGAKRTWEVKLETWKPYDEAAIADIEEARRRGDPTAKVRVDGHVLHVHIDRMVQKNPHTGREREVRMVDVPPPAGALSLEALDRAIALFEELETLSPAP